MTSTKRNLIYHTHVNVTDEISVQTGEGLETRLEALARDGLTLSCNRQTLDQLLPNREVIAPKQPVNLLTCFQLYPGTEAIESYCDVISVRRLARDTFHLDLRFHALEEESYQLIDSYVNAALHPQRSAHKQVA